jgi:glycosyltransferase involved in cell wall biosynthesis
VASDLEQDHRDIVNVTEDFEGSTLGEVDLMLLSLWSVSTGRYIRRLKSLFPLLPTVFIIHSLDIVERVLFDPVYKKHRQTHQEIGIQSSDLVVCVSQSERALYEQVGYMRLNEHVIVIPNIYVQQTFELPPVKAYECNHIGFIGRHILRKRPEIISRAVYETLGRKSDVLVYHAGVVLGRQEDCMFRDHTQEYDKEIIVLPFTTNQQQLQTEYWDKIGASCVTGLYEPFGYTVCEALDRYKPLICANTTRHPSRFCIPV